MIYFNENFILSILGKYDNIIVYVVLSLSILGLILIFAHRWKQSSQTDHSQGQYYESNRMFIKNNNSNKSNVNIDLKLQAYERLTIFLSRIDPWRLLSIVKVSEKNIKSIEDSLLKIIISEFEYNLSQQVYVSDNLWELIETSKNKTIQLILSVKEDLEKNATGQEFYNRLQSILQTQSVTPSKITLDYLKKEVRGI
tara:strand:+ start:360 stop:950 length:591 start_codon:yes stop_codon:yes gene_type:complete